MYCFVFFFFFQAEDGIRDKLVTGVQTCALPICKLTRGRLGVVFGCGGDRDRGKRPIMGEIAAQLGDRIWVTSDNPRSEPPEAIIDEIVAGIRRAGREERRYPRQADRRAALAEAPGWGPAVGAPVVDGN